MTEVSKMLVELRLALVRLSVFVREVLPWA